MKLNLNVHTRPRKGYYYKFENQAANWHEGRANLTAAPNIIYIINFSEKKAWVMITSINPITGMIVNCYKPSDLPIYKHSQWNPVYWDCTELTKEQAFEELL